MTIPFLVREFIPEISVRIQSRELDTRERYTFSDVVVAAPLMPIGGKKQNRSLKDLSFKLRPL